MKIKRDLVKKEDVLAMIRGLFAMTAHMNAYLAELLDKMGYSPAESMEFMMSVSLGPEEAAEMTKAVMERVPQEEE